MNDPFSCIICFEQYKTQGNHRPTCLPCGHSLCNSCCWQLPKQACPLCNTSFVRPVSFNYGLIDVIEQTNSVSSLPPHPPLRPPPEALDVFPALVAFYNALTHKNLTRYIKGHVSFCMIHEGWYYLDVHLVNINNVRYYFGGPNPGCWTFLKLMNDLSPNKIKMGFMRPNSEGFSCRLIIAAPKQAF
jgi:hypothetical protein